MSDQVDLDRAPVGPQGVAQRDELFGEQVERTAAQFRRFRVAAHLRPYAAEHQVAGRFDQAVCSFADLVRDATRRERSDFRLALEVILEHVDQRFDRPRLPRHEQRIDAVGGGIRRQNTYAPYRFVLAIQSAVRVDHQLGGSACGLLRKPPPWRVDHDLRRIGLRIHADAESHIRDRQHAVVAADQRMRVGVRGAPGLVGGIVEQMVDRPRIVARVGRIRRRLGLRPQRLTVQTRGTGTARPARPTRRPGRRARRPRHRCHVRPSPRRATRRNRARPIARPRSSGRQSRWRYSRPARRRVRPTTWDPSARR